ncbi:aryl hydrocarbon receptor nuclear translocator-like [Sinocyclocheilus grahami]|uniref:aryl hydrocarbon receptor nuclear translocator-like n=1 Tax=Sinocyclocheilus grahami TaxID=75366 RepID=UPI0007AD3087|nr:PREDICTED: aryl hydrocarbon receptor nuclear translocator-like [Sinocyclocheilus grahami]
MCQLAQEHLYLSDMTSANSDIPEVPSLATASGSLANSVVPKANNKRQATSDYDDDEGSKLFRCDDDDDGGGSNDKEKFARY